MASITKSCGCGQAKWRDCPHSYTVRWRHGRGSTQRERSFNPKQYRDPRDAWREADAWAKKVEADKALGVRLYDPKRGQTLFDPYAVQVVRDRTLADNSRSRYLSELKNHVNPHIGHRPIGAIRRTEIKTMVRAWRENQNLGASKISNMFTLVVMIFHEAERDGLIQPDTDPTQGLDDILPDVPVTELDIPTEGDIARITAALPPRLRVSAYLMSGCGLRPSEALAANERAVRDDATVYRVSQQVISGSRLGPLKHRKEGEFRDVPLPGYVHRAMLGSAKLGVRDGYLLPGSRGLWKPYSTLRKAWTKALAATGLQYDPRSLRHYFVSRALAAGCQITDVSEWVGHTDIKITFKIYRHLLPSSAAKARDALEAAKWGEWAA